MREDEVKKRKRQGEIEDQWKREGQIESVCVLKRQTEREREKKVREVLKQGALLCSNATAKPCYS